jgi:cbb3-type cytochrome oxidase maturation protein
VGRERWRPDVETIFVLLPLALLIATIAVGSFIWAVRTGQFDDLETPAVRILFDDEEPRRPARESASPAPAPYPSKKAADPTRRVSE